jgi:hypothetical protein
MPDHVVAKLSIEKPIVAHRGRFHWLALPHPQKKDLQSVKLLGRAPTKLCESVYHNTMSTAKETFGIASKWSNK